MYGLSGAEGGGFPKDCLMSFSDSPEKTQCVFTTCEGLRFRFKAIEQDTASMLKCNTSGNFMCGDSKSVSSVNRNKSVNNRVIAAEWDGMLSCLDCLQEHKKKYVIYAKDHSVDNEKINYISAGSEDIDHVNKVAGETTVICASMQAGKECGQEVMLSYLPEHSFLECQGIKPYLECIERLRAELKEKTDEIKKLKHENNYLVQKYMLPKPKSISYNGVLNWTIHDINTKLATAKKTNNDTEKYIYSPEFYMSENGYKFCAKVYFNGVGAGEGTHISFYLVQLKSENDASLSWPCHIKVTFMILGSSKEKDLSASFDAGPDSGGYQRPMDFIRPGRGYPEFFNQENLEQYTINGCLKIKVIVSDLKTQDRVQSGNKKKKFLGLL